MVISESIPSNARGRLVLSAFGFQAVGALVGTGVGYLILKGNPEIQAWRWMYAAPIVPGVLVLIGRFFITDSGQWLVSRGRIADAQHETRRLLSRRPRYPKEIKLIDPNVNNDSEGRNSVPKGYVAFFTKRNRRATILASIPWFLQDLGTYGIGIFTPIILTETIGARTDHPHNLASLIHNDVIAAKGAASLDILLIAGIAFAVLLTDKIGRIKLQIMGFIGCALGLLLAALSAGFDSSMKMFFIFAGFMLFNFMNNMGPNAQTYLLAGEVFPTHIRGKGAGLAASFAKTGAVMTAFLFPILLKDIGVTMLLSILVGTSLAGALITWFYRIETAGANLEQTGQY
jgi:MFS family permease